MANNPFQQQQNQPNLQNQEWPVNAAADGKLNKKTIKVFCWEIKDFILKIK